MSALPGKYQDLKMVKYTDFGIYLDGGDLGEILMPTKYVPHNTHEGDMVHCFVYFDSEDRPIATTEEAKAQVGECAFLRCVAVTKVGAFLDWGLTKDLLVPFREQNVPMEEGRTYCVYVYEDTVSRRIAASAKFNKHLNHTPIPFAEGDEVDLFIIRKTDQGWVAAINNSHTGLLYHSEIFSKLHPGMHTKGYVSHIRPDGKTDLKLQKEGYHAVMENEDAVIAILKQAGGFIPVTDKSDAEMIYEKFKMSKKSWKKIIGALYKKGIVDLQEQGIKLR